MDKKVKNCGLYIIGNWVVCLHRIQDTVTVKNEGIVMALKGLLRRRDDAVTYIHPCFIHWVGTSKACQHHISCIVELAYANCESAFSFKRSNMEDEVSSFLGWENTITHNSTIYVHPKGVLLCKCNYTLSPPWFSIYTSSCIIADIKWRFLP